MRRNVTGAVVGVVENSFYLTTSQVNGVTQITGNEYSLKLAQYMKDYGLNYTIGKVTKDFGDYVNGSYTGILKYLVSKEIDFAVLFAAPRVESDAFELSQPIGEYTNVIQSFTKPPLSTNNLDVVTSLGAFGVSIWLTVLVFAVMYLIIWKLLNKTLKPIDIYAIFFEQHYPKFTGLKIQFIALFMIMGLALVFDYVCATFSTSLAITVYPRKVETIKDVNDIDVTPMFYEPSRVQDYFKYALTSDQKGVWNKAVKAGLDNSVLKFEGIMSRLDVFRAIFSGKSVLLAPKCLEISWTKLICLCVNGNTDVIEGRMYFTSKPFGTLFVQTGLRKGLPYNLRERIIVLQYYLFEYGIIQRHIEDLQTGAINEISRNHFPRCESKLMERSRETNMETYVDIKLINFIYPQIILLTVMIVALLIPLLENLRKLHLVITEIYPE